MAIYLNGTVFEWYENTVYLNGVAISTPDSPGNVYLNGTQVFGLDGTYETFLYSNGLAPDSANFENNIVPYFQNQLADAFHSQSYTQGPGQDSTYRVYLKEGYRLESQDGNFNGTASPGTEINFYEGRTVTGINTSHNGGTSFSFYRDDGV